MPFVFKVETGAGLTDSNSYASTDEAEDYLTANIHVYPLWAALSADKQESLLAFATRTLDFRTRWNGEKTVEASALRWPRRGVSDRDGVSVPDNTLPFAVKAATIEVAASMISADRSAERGSDGFKEIQVDVVRLVFDEDYRLPTFPPNIAHILTGLGTVSGGRNNFVKITKV